jgi:hypothetical protein
MARPEAPVAGDASKIGTTALGNERLTGLAGGALLALIVAELVTLPNLRALLSPHVIVGTALAGPLVLKLMSTGYRAASYYLRIPAFVRRGPPRLPLRILAVPLAAANVLLAATGFGLMATGPAAAGPLVALHNLSAVVWLPLVAVHAVAYVRRATGLVRADVTRAAPRVPGRRLRLTGTVLALVCGILAAIVIAPLADAWRSWSGFAQTLPGPVVASVLVTIVALAVARPTRWTERA